MAEQVAQNYRDSISRTLRNQNIIRSASLSEPNETPEPHIKYEDLENEIADINPMRIEEMSDEKNFEPARKISSSKLAKRFNTFTPRNVIKSNSEFERWNHMSKKITQLLDEKYVQPMSVENCDFPITNTEDNKQKIRIAKISTPAFIKKNPKIKILSREVKINGVSKIISQLKE